MKKNSQIGSAVFFNTEFGPQRGVVLAEYSVLKRVMWIRKGHGNVYGSILYGNMEMYRGKTQAEVDKAWKEMF